MPIILLPAPSASVPSTSCAELATVRPGVTRLYDRPVPGKMRGLAVRQGRQATLEMVLFDDDGNPRDISVCGVVNTPGDTSDYVTLRLVEGCGYGSRSTGEVSGSVLDAAAGVISFDLSDTVVNVPGVYLAEAALLNGDGDLIDSNQLWLLVEPGLFGIVTRNGPPSLQSVRLMLRDHPQYNLLLDENAFDAAEISEAIVHAVQRFNSAPPPLCNVRLDTVSWPQGWKHNLLQGVAAFLLEAAAAWYRTSSLAVQGGGMAVDDLGRAAQFEKAAQYYRQQWETWVKATRVRLNAEEGFGEVFSPYSSHHF